MSSNNRQMFGTGNDAGTSTNNTIKPKIQRRVHWPDLMNLIELRQFEADEYSNEEQEDEGAKPSAAGQAAPQSSKRQHFGGAEISKIDQQREREKRKAFLEMNNNKNNDDDDDVVEILEDEEDQPEDEDEEGDVRPKLEEVVKDGELYDNNKDEAEKDNDDIICLSSSDEEEDDNKVEETKMERPWPGLHLVDINPLEWNLDEAMLNKWPFGGGKKSQTKLIEEERCAKTAENSNSDLAETGDELADFNPDHVPKTIQLELPFVDEEVNENAGNEGVEEGENNMSIQNDGNDEEEERGNNNIEEERIEEEDKENQQEEEQMEMDNFYEDYEEFGGDGEDENVVNEAVEDGPHNIIESATTQQRIANWEKTYNNQEMELDRTPCCSNSSLPKTSSLAKQQNINDPYEKFNELKRQLCELIKMPYDGRNTFTKEKIEQFLAIPNEEQNEESENEENQQQNDENHHHQMQANEEINKNSNEIDEALKICFGNFADDDEEEDQADGNDSHGIQQPNSIERIGNLLLERPKITLPKIKVDPDEDNPPTRIEIQQIINEVSNQQDHIVANSSMGQIDENIEEIEQGNQRGKKKKNENFNERIEKKKKKMHEKHPQRVQQQEEESSHQSSYNKNASSPPPATLSRHDHLQAFSAPPPTPNLINAGPSTNINFGVDAQPRCKFFSANKICREGENCLFYHDRSNSSWSKEIQRKNDGNCVYFFGRGFCFKGDKCTFLHGDMPTRGSELRNKQSAVFNELMSISTKSTIQPTSPKLPPAPAGLIPPPPPVPPKISLSSQQLLEGEMNKFWTSFSPPRPQPPQISLPQETEISHPPPPLPHQRIALSQQLLEAEMSPQPSVILASSSSATSPRKREHRRHRSSSRSHHSRRSPPPRRRSSHRHSSVHRHRSRSESISPVHNRRSRSHSRISIRQHQPTESARRSLRRRSQSDESISPIRTHRSRSRSRVSIRHIKPIESDRRSRSRSRTRTQIIIELSDDDEQQSDKPRNSDANKKYGHELPPQHDEFVRRQPNLGSYQHRMVLPVGHKSSTKPELRPFVEDCPHFVLNGWCGWNQNCRYSHGDAEPTRGYQNAVKALTHQQLMDSSLSQGVPPLTIPSRNDVNASSAVNNNEAPTTSRRERSRSRSRH